MIEARRRLREQNQRLKPRMEAARTRKEAPKASYAAVLGILKAREAMAALGLANDASDRRPELSAEAASAPKPGLPRSPPRWSGNSARRPGQEARPEGLMELWPGAPWHSDIRILFAAEPADTALRIAVLEGPEAVEDQYPLSSLGISGHAAPSKGWPGARSSRAWP